MQHGIGVLPGIQGPGGGGLRTPYPTREETEKANVHALQKAKTRGREGFKCVRLFKYTESSDFCVKNRKERF